MPRYIIKLTDKNNKDYYMEWSTIVDAPTTYGFPLEEFKRFYRLEYGESSLPNLELRLQRVEVQGTSSYGTYTLDELLQNNRAGKKEECLTKDEIIKKYCYTTDPAESYDYCPEEYEEEEEEEELPKPVEKIYTEKTIWVGDKRAVVIRSTGHVYIAEKESEEAFDSTAKLVATSSAGCTAMSEALLEAAEYLRNRSSERKHKPGVDVMRTEE